MKTNKVLIVFTILSSLLAVFGMFHIPLLSLMGVQFPSRNLLWGLSIIPTVILFCVPLVICVYCFQKRKNKNKK